MRWSRTGAALSDLGCISKAYELYAEAVEIRRRLVSAGRSDLKGALAEVLEDMAKALRQTGQEEAANAAETEAAKLISK